VTSIYAHRGSTGLSIRENTLEAFRSAARLGADGVELDVRRTADGYLVLHHDLESPGVGSISACRRIELPEWVPTLVEALDLSGELGLDVNVEVKSEVAGPSHDPMERCAAESAEVCAAAGAKVRIIVSSFSVAALAAVRAVSSDLALAWLVGFGSGGPAPPWSGGVLAALSLEGIHPQDAVIDDDYVRRAHDDGLAVRAWTVDAPARVAELAGFGVDAIITNDVATALGALGRSGAVPPS
jgi:glycerophosphoryl diester phosphodiesterase